MAKKQNEMSYSEAFEELQQIVSEIETGEISVDELSEKVRRAGALMKVCKEKLTSTEGEVKKILQGLEIDETPETSNNNE